MITMKAGPITMKWPSIILDKVSIPLGSLFLAPRYRVRMQWLHQLPHWRTNNNKILIYWLKQAILFHPIPRSSSGILVRDGNALLTSINKLWFYYFDTSLWQHQIPGRKKKRSQWDTHLIQTFCPSSIEGVGELRRRCSSRPKGITLSHHPIRLPIAVYCLAISVAQLIW